MKVKDEPNLERDPSNGVVQNTNQDAYRAYIAKRNAILENKNRFEAIEKDNAEIKQTLSMILELLRGNK